MPQKKHSCFPQDVRTDRFGVRAMPYNETAKKATIKYIKDKQQRIEIKWKKTDYDTRIAPAIEKSGQSVSAFIKDAVEEKIKRDRL